MQVTLFTSRCEHGNFQDHVFTSFLGREGGPGSTEPSQHSCDNWLPFCPAEGKQVQLPHRRVRRKWASRKWIAWSVEPG